MSSNEVEPGLVKQIPFQDPPGHKVIGIGNPIQDFHHNTARVVRVAGLSKPIVSQHPENIKKNAQKAYLATIRTLNAQPELKGIPFTIIDDTNWADAVPTEVAGSDILYINVYWENDIPLMVAVLGHQRVYKTGKLFRMWEGPPLPVAFYIWPDQLLGPGLDDVARAAEEAFLGLNLSYLSCSSILTAYANTLDRELEYPIAAATYLDDVIWYVDRPYRHHHIVHSPEYQQAKNNREDTRPDKREVQGFLTNHGNFVQRYRGMLQAVRHRMIIGTENISVSAGYAKYRRFMGILYEGDLSPSGPVVAGTALFSEDMW